MTKEEKIIQFKKGMSEFFKESTISECFHPKKEECVLPIKQANSLQRNGRLSLIEDDVNGQNQLYTQTSFKTSSKRFITDFVPVGKKSASTFYGFCDYHDTNIFSEIENKPFDGSDKHIFLHSYRSFAHSYHRKNEELKVFKSDWAPAKQMNKDLKEQHLKVNHILNIL